MWRHLSILGVACILTFFAGLGRAAINDSDEAFYAEAAREMIESGDWITPRYNYEPRFQKPILYYWLAAASLEAAGVEPGAVTSPDRNGLAEAAARFPSAFAGLALAMLTYACGRRWVNPRTGLIAGLIAATNFGYFFIGRLALPDLPLAFFVALATWASLESLRAGRTGSATARRRWILVASAAAALGMLTKGPVAIALPGLVVAVVLFAPRPPTSVRIPWTWTDVALAIALFAAIAVPWYAFMVREHGPAYLYRFFVGENLERFATDRYNEPRPIGYYVPIVFGGLLPWSPFIALWLPGVVRLAARQRSLGESEWLLGLWAGLPLVFYSLSIGKQPRYILPVLPPLAVLIARSIAWRIERAARDRRRLDPALAWCATVGALVLITFGVLLHRAKPLLFALAPSAGLVATTVILIAGVAVAIVAWSGRPRHLVGTIASASTATLLALYYSVYSAAGLDPVQRMAQLVATHRDGTARIGTYRVFVRNLVFYTATKQTDLRDEAAVVRFFASDQPGLCVISADDLATFRSRHAMPAVPLGQLRYVNAAGLRLRNLLWPNPALDLDTVVLVRTR